MRKGWEIKKLSEVLRIQNGYAFNSKLFTTEKGTPLIRIRDIKNGIGTETKFNGPYDEKYQVKAGDFLIGMDGEFGCYEWKGEKALLNQRVCRLQEFNSRIYSRFLFYGINKYLKAIEDVTAYVTVKHISSRQIENIEIPLPPLPEQKQIVSILDKAFTAIDKVKFNTEKNLQNVKDLFESYLQNVFENPGEDWEEKKLDEIAFVKSGGTPSRAKKEYWNGNIAWYSSGELNDLYTKEPERFINDEAMNNSNAKLFPKGSLLIGMYDTAALKMSITDRDATFNQAIAGVKPNEKIDLIFILHSINSIKTDLLNLRRGVRQKNLSLEKIKDIAILLPPLNVQQTIVKKLDSLSKETKKLESIYQQKLNDLEELKKSILQKAFAGELTTAKELTV